jgi:hypothetical protein
MTTLLKPGRPASCITDRIAMNYVTTAMERLKTGEASKILRTKMIEKK